MRRALVIGGLALLLAAASPPDGDRILDGFEDVSRWKAAPSEGVSLSLASDAGVHGRALRMDFDFRGRSGWAAARRENLALDLPQNWEFSFRIRGEAPVNNLEFKLVDPSGENVWWVNRRNFEFPRDWRRITIKKRHVEFAWGPAGGGELRRIGAIELTITAGSGGKGSVWVDDLTFTPLPPAKPYARIPSVTASSAAAGRPPNRALDGRPETAWHTAGAVRNATLTADFLERREYGGLTIVWDDEAFASRYVVETSDDGHAWTAARAVERGNGGRDPLYLPESESRFLRVRMSTEDAPKIFGIREIRVEPLAFSASPNAFFSGIAKELPRGSYPRGFSGEQLYWTVVGMDGDRGEGLFSEDAALETGRGGFSLEPFLWVDGRLWSWADVAATHSLAHGELPIPTVTWRAGGITLEITALAAGVPGDSALYARYHVRNESGEPKKARLLLAVRPFQVNPPSQFLNVAGGVAPVRSIAWDGFVATVDGKRVRPLDPPDAFGAASFDEGDVTEWLRRGEVPAAPNVTDAFGYASGAFAWDLALAPGAARRVDVSADLRTGRSGEGAAPYDDAFAATLHEWRRKVERAWVTVPPPAMPLARTAKTALAHVLVNRDGPAIQPGSRSYERSWIRDGALTSAALLRLGHGDTVREFIEWFAPYQYDTGMIPCCVDSRGADPVPENDSHGEFLFLVAEHARLTGERRLLERMWPRVERTVAYIDKLRDLRRTEEYRRPPKLAFFGLLPESISHEGYSAKPVHSYWDDLFALKGLKDAAEIAAMLGRESDRARWTATAAEFRADLLASIRRVVSERRIEYIPGSAELADFDATSTTIAFDPVGEADNLPQRELLRTFERYYEEFRKRRDSASWDAYTPYEIRAVGTFVRLGWRERAHELLDFFMASRRPAGWNQWTEVVGREVRRPRFIGDMPHGWVASDYIRSFLDLFAYARDRDSALVLAAGIPTPWITAPGGVGVRRLRTRWGVLNYSLSANEERARLELSGGVQVPAGGIVLALPPELARGATGATINDRRAPLAASGEVVIREIPARVDVRLAQPEEP